MQLNSSNKGLEFKTMRKGMDSESQEEDKGTRNPERVNATQNHENKWMEFEMLKTKRSNLESLQQRHGTQKAENMVMEHKTSRTRGST